ncbi:hypothetical protein P154DRAFT_591727 [Amniculicola lignicola CBS 123094]|uniref:DUF7580 domain-containing protein n=1 Tax=Amniculicola lignicola CBS 123094 TaxID=1392246 RepID=A0A6A5VVG6_9PLEO|nr:hypothetical protein P154DRAFT_591727 [Amniculicola lignicola CBS 123094]
MDPLDNDDGTKNYLAQLIEKPVPLEQYAAVKVVILYWENSDRLDDYVEEAGKVDSFFKGLNFETELYPIPKSNSQVEVRWFITKQQVLLTRRMSILGAPCLLIVHYGGHGDKDDDIHYTGSGGPQRRRAVWRAHRKGEPSVRWYEIQQLFLDIKFDVVLLFDCCYAAQAGRSAGEETLDEPPGCVELLAAAGDKAETPHPGDGSFTVTMIRIMDKYMKTNNNIEISTLHTLLVHRNAGLSTIPFHVYIRAGPSKRSVVLKKLKAPGEQEDSTVAWRAAVGVTIGMREPLTQAILDEIGRWLHAEAPRAFVAGFKVERVLRRTADISGFIKDSLPERSGAVAQSLKISVLEQIGDAWSSLQQLVTRYTTQRNVPGFTDQEDRMAQLAGEFVKRLDAGNTEITQILQKAVMMSDASLNPTMIDKALEDPASESLGMTSQLILRRIICCQQRPELGEKATVTSSTVLLAPDRLIEEYKKYDEHRSPEEITEMKARIGLLADVLGAQKPESFRCLQLHEWKHEKYSRRFVYHFRIPDNYKKKPITLYDAITTLDRHSRPTLEERLTMAHHIAKAVEQWHRVDWVHQSISSHNIIFLKPESGNSNNRWDFDAPLLHGFDFARPNAKPSIGRYVEDIELNIYRHPDRQGEVRNGHKKEHDLYSLGVVLLEIGLWRSSCEMVEQRARSLQKARKSAATKDEASKVAKDDMVEWLVDAVRDSLAHYVGSDYQDAVRTCLTSEFGVKIDDERKSRLLDAMGKMVLQKLEWWPII